MSTTNKQLIETIQLPEGQRIEVFFEALEEDTPVRGNLIDTGDAVEDRKLEDEVLERLDRGDLAERLDRGDLAAWFCARITAEVRVSRNATAFYLFTGDAHLGGCSYAKFEEFLNERPTLVDLRDEAIHDLLSNAREEVKRAESARILVGVLEKLT